MSRYIDATALKKYISCIPALDGWRNMIRLICAWVDKQPTADVAPVIHARWIKLGQDIFCSACGEESAYNPFGASKFSRCCPNCGAKMDGGENE